MVKIINHLLCNAGKKFFVIELLFIIIFKLQRKEHTYFAATLMIFTGPNKPEGCSGESA